MIVRNFVTILSNSAIAIIKPWTVAKIWWKDIQKNVDSASAISVE